MRVDLAEIEGYFEVSKRSKLFLADIEFFLIFLTRRHKERQIDTRTEITGHRAGDLHIHSKIFLPHHK